MQYRRPPTHRANSLRRTDRFQLGEFDGAHPADGGFIHYRADRASTRWTGSRMCLRAWLAFVCALTVVVAAAVVAMAPMAYALGGEKAGVAIVATSDGDGYTLLSATGGTYTYGLNRPVQRDNVTRPSAPIVDGAVRPGTDHIWMAGADGAVYSVGGNESFGSLAGRRLASPIVAIAASPTGLGYLLVASNGETFPFGDYENPGSLTRSATDAPIVDVVRPSGGGLLLATSDGAVIAMAGARYHGSLTDRQPGRPTTAIVDSPTRDGYLLVTQDGSAFPFGDYPWPEPSGQPSGTASNVTVVDATRMSTGGVWMTTATGSVIGRGAPLYGDATGTDNPPPVKEPTASRIRGQMAVSCPRGGTIIVNERIARSVAKLLAAAEANGMNLCGNGYRTRADQILLRRRNCGIPATADGTDDVPSTACSPPTAPPGKSLHEKGLAIDFANCSTRRTHCYRWLAGNAAHFGLKNLPSEPWHWSTTGR